MSTRKRYFVVSLLFGAASLVFGIIRQGEMLSKERLIFNTSVPKQQSTPQADYVASSRERMEAPHTELKPMDRINGSRNVTVIYKNFEIASPSEHNTPAGGENPKFENHASSDDGLVVDETLQIESGTRFNPASSITSQMQDIVALSRQIENENALLSKITVGEQTPNRQQLIGRSLTRIALLSEAVRNKTNSLLSDNIQRSLELPPATVLLPHDESIFGRSIDWISSASLSALASIISAMTAVCSLVLALRTPKATPQPIVLTLGQHQQNRRSERPKITNLNLG